MEFQFFQMFAIFRGEKLYVTKDKRLKSNWRKRVLWIIGLALCAAVLILAILFASEYTKFTLFLVISLQVYLFNCCTIFHLAGTLGSEPELIESRSSKDKLATAGFFGSGSKAKENDTTPQPPGSTVPPHPPTTDENIMFGRFFG